MKIPPFIATLGTMMIARGGLALVISGLAPIYFSDAPSFTNIAMGSVLANIVPGFEIPNAVLVLFVAAIIASLFLSETISGGTPLPWGATKKPPGFRVST